MKVIYLHGFASSGESSKSNWLRDYFAGGANEFISPDLPNKPGEAALFLDGYLADFADEAVCLIGTSLGGFFAACYGGRFGWPCVLINPLADIDDLTGSAMGENTNFATGERFIMDQNDADMLTAMSEALDVGKVQSLLLLDKGDELLDYRKALARYGESSQVHLFEGGSHRFDHLPESISEIMALTSC
ncbi:hypothetical protein Ga0123462_1684 [Mariprofundus ferrinatatus]|uniref:Esterase n=1 Tax=Mariprofundus ferrinatatus TaxID=1921087 RepID=A0A2K8L5M3_9PROT|nr:YqiA/YcfP family alpha/beta fold hydrolase [Mariprofundus ferrinatatus]ATX82533.1 hypothetical protein Ga0123462_1684 [Mariprofundus ferrinatatus]